jgi:hypothetical protein
VGKIKDRKITISLAADVAATVDMHVAEDPGQTNRSKIIEEALRVWETLHQYGDVQKVFEDAINLYKQEQERELYRSYYTDRSEEAKLEAAGWRQVGADSASLSNARLGNAKKSAKE